MTQHGAVIDRMACTLTPLTTMFVAWCCSDELVQGLAKSSDPVVLARAAGYDPSRSDPYYRDGGETAGEPEHPDYHAPDHPRYSSGPDREDRAYDRAPRDEEPTQGERPHYYGSYSGPKGKDVYKRGAPYRPDANPANQLKECKGTCVSGHCKLDVSKPRCCYLPAAQAARLAAQYEGSPQGYGSGNSHREVLCWGNEDGKPSYAMLESHD